MFYIWGGQKEVYSCEHIKHKYYSYIIINYTIFPIKITVNLLLASPDSWPIYTIIFLWTLLGNLHCPSYHISLRRDYMKLGTNRKIVKYLFRKYVDSFYLETLVVHTWFSFFFFLERTEFRCLGFYHWSATKLIRFKDHSVGISVLYMVKYWHSKIPKLWEYSIAFS